MHQSEKCSNKNRKNPKNRNKNGENAFSVKKKGILWLLELNLTLTQTQLELNSYSTQAHNSINSRSQSEHIYFMEELENSLHAMSKLRHV